MGAYRVGRAAGIALAMVLGMGGAMAAPECPVVDEPSLTKTYECLRLHQQTLNEILGVLQKMQSASSSVASKTMPASDGSASATGDALARFQGVSCLGNRAQCRDQAVADVLTYCRRMGFKRGDPSGLVIAHHRGSGLSYSVSGVGCR